MTSASRAISSWRQKYEFIKDETTRKAMDRHFDRSTRAVEEVVWGLAEADLAQEHNQPVSFDLLTTARKVTLAD